jgi:predicted DNA binding CopG/RHH family protein
MKVDPELLNAFKTKSAKKDIPYQTQIKRLMQQWLSED